MTVTSVENEDVLLKRKKTKRGKKKPASAKNAAHKKVEASHEKKEKLAKTSFLTELGGHCLLQVRKTICLFRRRILVRFLYLHLKN